MIKRLTLQLTRKQCEALFEIVGEAQVDCQHQGPAGYGEASEELRKLLEILEKVINGTERIGVRE